MTDEEFADNVELASENADQPFEVSKGSSIEWHASQQAGTVAWMRRQEGQHTNFEIEVTENSPYSITSVELM